MMGGHIAEGGKMAKHMAVEFAPDPRARASIVDLGPMALRSWESTPGPVGTLTRAPGLRARGMEQGSRTKVAGCTRASGLMALRDAMVCERASE